MTPTGTRTGRGFTALSVTDLENDGRRGTPWGAPPSASSASSANSGSQDLVEDGLGLVLVGVLGERQLADQDLAGLGEHALLAGRQAAVLVAAPQVTDDLGDLDDVTR